MKDQTNNQPGAQRHAEGTYGDAAREANRERLVSEPADDNVISHGPDGRHRLHEDRQQHDEADKNSEKNRLDKEEGRTRTK